LRYYIGRRIARWAPVSAWNLVHSLMISSGLSVDEDTAPRWVGSKLVYQAPRSPPVSRSIEAYFAMQVLSPLPPCMRPPAAASHSPAQPRTASRSGCPHTCSGYWSLRLEKENCVCSVRLPKSQTPPGDCTAPRDEAHARPTPWCSVSRDGGDAARDGVAQVMGRKCLAAHRGTVRQHLLGQHPPPICLSCIRELALQLFPLRSCFSSLSRRILNSV
jgi:hypothetical protein